MARRIALRGVPWNIYEQLLAVVGDGLPRMTYDRGLLEFEMPSGLHEAYKWIIGRFIEAYAEASGIRYEPTGSTTWRRKAIQGGLEADESYYIQNFDRVRGREVNLECDPPPDLAVEIDTNPPEMDKASVYSRLGVPEIWRWRDGSLAVLVRHGDGSYAAQAKSVALPGFPLSELTVALEQYPEVESADSVRAFRQRLRAQMAKR